MSKSNLFSSFIPLNSNKQHDEECYLNDLELLISSDELVHHFKEPGFDPKTEASRKGIIKLHQEIETFFRTRSPSLDSHTKRLNVLSRLKSVLMGKWPNVVIETFGSFATGLYLPSSDLDVVIIGKWEVIPFITLERIITDIAASNSIEIIDGASVPIVRYIDKVTDIKVDLSFNSLCGPQCAQIIKVFKKQFPVLPKLVLVLKQFLLERDLSTVYTGGLSSYSLTLMVVSFLQLHVREDVTNTHAQVNLGVLLMEFLHLYAHTFNYDSLGISVRDGGKYFSKRSLTLNPHINKRWTDVQNLVVEHCLEPMKDAAKGTYNIQAIRFAFAYAYKKLAIGLRRSEYSNETILHTIIK